MDETRKRSITKSITWRIICIIVSVLTAYLFTNRLDLAAALGAVYNAATMILYYFHERFWIRIKWGVKSN
jgi:adenylylsulfate kinase